MTFEYKKPANSRTADKFVVRLPDGMRDDITDLAAQAHMSINSYMVLTLIEGLKRGHGGNNERWSPHVGQLVILKDTDNNSDPWIIRGFTFDTTGEVAAEIEQLRGMTIRVIALSKLQPFVV